MSGTYSSFVGSGCVAVGAALAIACCTTSCGSAEVETSDSAAPLSAQNEDTSSPPAIGDMTSDSGYTLNSGELPPRCEGDASCCMGLPVKNLSNSFSFNFESSKCLLLGEDVTLLQDLGFGNVIVGGIGTQDQVFRPPTRT